MLRNKRILYLIVFLLMGTNVFSQFRMGNTLAPKEGNPYPIIISNDAKGGLHQVATITERNNIPALRRVEGMLCVVLDSDGAGTPNVYQLINGIDNANWVLFNPGGAGSGSNQLLSISNDTIFLTNGGFVKIPGGNFDGKYTSLADIPADIADGDDDTQLSSAQVQTIVQDAGYLKATDEADPLFSASVAGAISAADTTRWSTASSFDGNFSSLAGIPAGLADGDDNTQLTEAEVLSIVNSNGYLSSFTEVDPLFSAHSASTITATNIATWNTVTGKFTLPVLTSGSLLFSNGTSIVQDNNLLFWDDANKRLCLGLKTGNEQLTLSGVLSFQEQPDAPLLNPGFGKIYVKPDGLYFLNASGTETNISAGAVKNWEEDASANVTNTNSGNVGIGTTEAPSEKLEVNGNVKVKGYISGDDNGNVIIQLGN